MIQQQQLVGWTLLADKKSSDNGTGNLSEEIAETISEMKQERNTVVYGQNTNQTPVEAIKESEGKRTAKDSSEDSPPEEN